MSRRFIFLTPLSILWLVFLTLYSASGQISAASVLVLDRQGALIGRLTDGDLVQLAVILPENAAQNAEALFYLGAGSTPLAGCTIQAGENRC